MPKRYHCEFKDCNCHSYSNFIGNICKICKHGKIWHSRTELPPSDSYLAFLSPRLPARTPIYIRKRIIKVFEPEVPPLPDSSDDELFCEAIEVLPV